MNHPLYLALALTMALSAWADVGSAQLPQTQYGVDVDLVRFHVAVINSSGEEVPPLAVEDFTVYDNGVPQQIQFMLQPSDTPLNVALVIDYSPSVQPYQHSLQRAAISFLAGLSGEDCPYVLPFSEQIGPGQWGRYGPREWSRFFEDAPRGYGTSLFDSVLIALNQLDLADEIAAEYSVAAAKEEGGDRLSESELHYESEPSSKSEPLSGLPKPRPELPLYQPEALTREVLLAQIAVIMAEIMRDMPSPHLGNCAPSLRGADDSGGALEDDAKKAILLLSDGSDTNSSASLADMLTAARLAAVPVFPVVLGPARRDAQLMARLSTLARATGGLVVQSDDGAGLTAAFHEVLAYTRSSYILAYDPDATSLTEDLGGKAEPQAGDQQAGEGSAGPVLGAWHNVRVELRRPLLQVIVRPGYYR